MSDSQGLCALSVSSLSLVIFLLGVDVFSEGLLFITSSSESRIDVLQASKYSTNCCCGIGHLRAWLYLSHK